MERQRFSILVTALFALTIANPLRADIIEYIGADGQKHQIDTDAPLKTLKAAQEAARDAFYKHVEVGSSGAEPYNAIVKDYSGHYFDRIKQMQTGGKRTVYGDRNTVRDEEIIGLNRVSPEQEHAWYLEEQVEAMKRRHRDNTDGYGPYWEKQIRPAQKALEEFERDRRPNQERTVYASDLLGDDVRLSTVQRELDNVERETHAADMAKREAWHRGDTVTGAEKLQLETKLVWRRDRLRALKRELMDLPKQIIGTHHAVAEKLKAAATAQPASSPIAPKKCNLGELG